MIARRLSWAGVELTEGGVRLLVDPLQDTEPFRFFAGPPKWPLMPVRIDPDTWVLVTHQHADHCDRGLLGRVRRGQALAHDPVAALLTGEGLNAGAVHLWQTAHAGPFQVTPVPAQDWRSDDQVSWVIEAGGTRVIHCGDTIWHGQWYAIARRYAPVDIAFLPINGFLAQLDGFTPTEVPGSLTPEQAVEAAVVLGAGTACAIHHSLFDNQPSYTQQPDAVERFLTAASRRHIIAAAPADGEAPDGLPRPPQ